MLPRFVTSLLILLGFAAPAAARDLFVEVEVLHLNGPLAQAELATMLASPQLTIEAHYQPKRLIDGETARRERIMPIGSKLFAIPQQTNLRGEQIERKNLGLRFKVSEHHPAHAEYRLQSLALRVPIANAFGRPQPDLHIGLSDAVPTSGAHETAILYRQVAIAVGLRVHMRWSDTPESVAYTPAPAQCTPDIHALGKGQYRFRPEHPAAGFFHNMPDAADARRAKLPAVFKQLQTPYPQPLTGWTLQNSNLTQIDVADRKLERLSIYATHDGPGDCRRSKNYEALFADGRPVNVIYSHSVSECGNAVPDYRGVEAHWLDNGSLASYVVNDARGNSSWDAFAATNANCGKNTAVAPSAAEVDALKSELQRLRAAFAEGSK